MWDGSNRQRETELWPVRVPLLRELNDYRLFLIRAEDQEKFNAVRTLADLRSSRLGMPSVNWPSTDILRANDLPVITSIAYEYLFPDAARQALRLHAARRVRSGERTARQCARPARGRAHDFPALPCAVLFFVSKENAALGQRVERGLRIALKDGSADKLFDSIPAFRDAQAEIDSRRRRVFELKVP
ncbi:hypothetical protein LP420_17785 [Massilia sp. B-10]|nr:hypothetical protein LP420_17785 [Massilia sp. B-10]